jgi:hypothetical protein
MQKVTSYRNFLGFSLILIVVVFLGYAVFVSWILRDGLGPDAIDSNGLVAFQRFFKSFGPMLLMYRLNNLGIVQELGFARTQEIL